MDSRATLLEALQALYHHPDPTTRLAANRWLENFQQTVDAWQISDNLLHDSTCSLDVHYFCAQTLRTKIQRDFEDLPPGAALSLRSSLMDLLVKFCLGPPAVRTQLCLALAALSMHMGSDDWGNVGMLQWLGGELGSRPDAVPALSELLTVLPQEANSWKVAVRPERRRQYQVALISSIEDAFSLLVSCLRTGSADLQEQVLRAFAAWLRLSSGIPAATLATHPLVLASLSGLESERTFDAAVDAVAELIRYTVWGTSIDFAAQMPLVQVLVPRVMALRPRFTAAMKAAVSLKPAEDGTEAEDLDVDEETVKGMAYLFSEMGESYVELIATGSTDAMVTVEALTEVTSHPDYDIARMTFNFWHHLSSNLMNRASYLSLGNEAAINAERERRLEVFRPSFELLVSLVSFRVMYPPEFETWRKDELADFKQTRYSVADVLLDVTKVLGGQATLNLLARPLLHLGNNDGNKLLLEWRSIEASLYCIRAIGKAVPLSENTIMPEIMALLPKLPTQPQLLYTSSLTIAAFADWLQASPNSRTLLPALLQLLINALSASEDPSAAAALALKYVCDACRVQLGDSVEALLVVYQQVINGGEKFKLSFEDELQVVEGLSLVVGALPPDRLPRALDALCLPVLGPLQQLVTAAQQAGPDQQFSARQYTILIDRIANIFRYANTPEPLAAVFQQMWPLLKTVFAQRAADTRTMERLCRACKYVVHSCGRALGGAMGPLLEELQERFQQHQHPCLLYLASEVIKVFGSDQSCAEYLGALITTLLGKTVSLLQSIEDFTLRPDLADDCFLFSSRCVRYCPPLLVLSPIFFPLLDCAMTGITIQHREACRSVLAFLEEVFELTRTPGGKPYQAAVDKVLLPRGSALTRVLIAALVGALPESRLDEVIHTFLSFARLYGSNVVQWAQEAASLIPNAIVTETEKLNFLQALSSAASGGESPTVTSSIEELSDVCRRNKKVIDAVQSALQPLRLTLTSSS